jgi:feruloyl esterase
LAKLHLSGGRIDSAVIVEKAAFVPPPGTSASTGSRAAYDMLRTFCRVAATLTPTTDSNIKIEVWLPANGWNGRYEGVGNGGWAGTISYAALARAVADGYASASTDTGHVGPTASFAVGHPEKLVDFGYRAIHEMTVQAKVITERFYGRPATEAIFNGCSQGGRQGITEAERFSADYDAIVAGAPGIYNMEINVARVALNRFVNRTATSAVPKEKYALVHDAVMKACDAKDGVVDGVLENPLQCTFDPQTLACTNGDLPSCLTQDQVESARAMYAPITNPQTGKKLSPPLLQPGTELGWNILAGPTPVSTAFEGVKYITFGDPTWDVGRFDPKTDIEKSLAADHGILSLTDPNLRPFFARGGKLLMYHGWQDPQVPAQNTVRYFNDIRRTLGDDVVGTSVQLYMVPGMNHCASGPGTDTFDMVKSIESWRASGLAPNAISAAHRTNGKVDRTRPLCPYGQVAKWNGTGDTNDEANFRCTSQ